MKPLCIYHDKCADGFGAAWIVHKSFNGQVDMHAALYEQSPPDVEGRDVIVVDFSYKKPALTEMSVACRSMIILDHHKSAKEDLKGLPEPNWPFTDHVRKAIEHGYHDSAFDHNQYNVAAIFDMDRSGAGITWDYFIGGARPEMITMIEDRDIWKFDNPNSKAFHAGLMSHPFSFTRMDQLMFDKKLMVELLTEGGAILRAHFKMCDEIIKACKRSIRIDGHWVPVCSAPFGMASDIGHILSEPEDVPFAAVYWDTPESRHFSLRAGKHGMDVSEIAVKYGGGGHAGAAGFTVYRNHELATV